MWVEEQVRSPRPQAHLVLVTTRMPCSPCTIYQRLGTGVPGLIKCGALIPCTAELLRHKQQHGCVCLGNPAPYRKQVGPGGACEPKEAVEKWLKIIIHLVDRPVVSPTLRKAGPVS